MRLPILSMAVITGFLCIVISQASAQDFDDEAEAGAGRAAYERLRLRDPLTREIPENIRARELQFALQRTHSDAASKGNVATAQTVDWMSRGPSNVGARTRALGIDIANENIILAGGTSGGMWRSTDKGASWTRTTSLTELPSTTCLAQDMRSGKTNTWYYGTGELGGNTAAYPLWMNNGPYKFGEYYGNGIYKSTDDGITWAILPATHTDTIGTPVAPFNIVNDVAVDPSNSAQDIVYAAVGGGVERSSDGGATWTMVLGAFPDGPAFTDVTVTSKGVVYAILGPVSMSQALSSTTGLYRSSDGIHWANITPAGWQFKSAVPRYVSCAIAPSNERVLYAAIADSMQIVFWKYTYLSGDGSGAGGTCEDRSANCPGGTFVDYVKVKPDDENMVFLGGPELYRSSDGFSSSSMTSDMAVPHTDQNAMAFFPSTSASMIIGSDGGLYQTNNNLGSSIIWSSLNNNYVTTQFYTVAIDHSAPGDVTIIGGMQDNGTSVTTSQNEQDPWDQMIGADGGVCAIAPGGSAYYVSRQFGATYSENPNTLNSTRTFPLAAGMLFVNPFILDPTNADRMYYGGGSVLWRQDSLHAIPVNDPTPGWDKLTHTAVTAVGTIDTTSLISFIAASKTPANRVYFGTTDGQLFRIDNANVGDPIATPIWIGKGFPASAYVSSIAVDAANADNVIVAFANYNVQSLFSTTDGGTTWTSIGGNLEEHPDGSGSGPSCRSVAIMHSGDGLVYLVGTSTGLYSTSTLNGMSTVWTLEGETSIGNSIVNMIDTRESDGMVAVATCGHGMFSGHVAPALSVIEDQTFVMSAQNFPNPFTTETEIKFELAHDGFVTMKIYDVLGREMTTVLSRHCTQGSNAATWNVSNVPAGSYYCRLTSGTECVVRQLMVAR